MKEIFVFFLLLSKWAFKTEDKGPNVDSEEICGFQYKSWLLDFSGQVYLGDCYGNKSYICWNLETLRAEVHEGSYYKALALCDVIHISFIRNFTPGYYWVKYTKNIKKMVFYDSNRTSVMIQYPDIKPFKCGAYSVDEGHYFRECSDEILTLCHFAYQPVGYDDWSCGNAAETSTYSSSLSTSVAEPTTNTSDIPKPVNQSKGTDVGKVVGLSVGICLALVCSIILSFYISRRYKCWKTTERKNNKRPDISYFSNQVQFHNNHSYEETENAAMNKQNRDTNTPEKSNASIVDGAPVYAEVNTIKVQQANLARNEMSPQNVNINEQSRHPMKDGVYSFAKETHMEINNDGKANDITVSVYDTSGTVQEKRSGKSNNIYNSLGNEEYNTVANVKGGDKPDNIYNHTQMPSESYYASTSHVSNFTPCDNVYNHLP